MILLRKRGDLNHFIVFLVVSSILFFFMGFNILATADLEGNCETVGEVCVDTNDCYKDCYDATVYYYNYETCEQRSDPVEQKYYCLVCAPYGDGGKCKLNEGRKPVSNNCEICKTVSGKSGFFEFDGEKECKKCVELHDEPNAEYRKKGEIKHGVWAEGDCEACQYDWTGNKVAGYLKSPLAYSCNSKLKPTDGCDCWPIAFREYDAAGKVTSTAYHAGLGKCAGNTCIKREREWWEPPLEISLESTSTVYGVVDVNETILSNLYYLGPENINFSVNATLHIENITSVPDNESLFGIAWFENQLGDDDEDFDGVNDSIDQCLHTMHADSNSTTIGAAGGNLTVPSGNAWFYIPAGALSQAHTFYLGIAENNSDYVNASGCIQSGFSVNITLPANFEDATFNGISFNGYAKHNSRLLFNNSVDDYFFEFGGTDVDHNINLNLSENISKSGNLVGMNSSAFNTLKSEFGLEDNEYIVIKILTNGDHLLKYYDNGTFEADVTENSTKVANYTWEIPVSIGFSMFGSNDTANLTIWDETDKDMPYANKTKYPKDNVTFFANYTYTNGTALKGANCTFYLYIFNYTMQFNSSIELYTYPMTIYNSGNISFNIVCDHQSLAADRINLTDNMTINRSADLDTWDDSDPRAENRTQYMDEPVRFYANYTNHSSGEAINITGAFCSISKSGGGVDNMSYNTTSKLYEKTYVFSSKGYVDYLIVCDAPGYETLDDYDSIFIASTAIPEFSTITALLALIIVISGFFVIRKHFFRK